MRLSPYTGLPCAAWRKLAGVGVFTVWTGNIMGLPYPFSVFEVKHYIVQECNHIFVWEFVR
jgi:hypothetical protein